MHHAIGHHGKRLFLRQAGGWVAGLALAGGAHAQKFPSRPVTLLVPYPAGGVSDLIARTVNGPLARRLGQAVTVENLGGASGAMAAMKLLAAPADGHVLFQGSPNELILAPLANAMVRYRSEDFRPVQMISTNPMALFARPDLPAANGNELLAAARKAAARGAPLTYASVGPGSMYHLLGEHLSRLAGMPLVHVPYKGIAPAVQAVMTGAVDFIMTPYSLEQATLVREGRLRAVAVLSHERQPLLPKAPPLHEAAGLADFVFDTWSGYFVRKETPEPAVQALHQALSEVAGDTAIRRALQEQTMTVPSPQGLAAVGKVYAELTQKYRAMARAMNLQPQ